MSIFKSQKFITESRFSRYIIITILVSLFLGGLGGALLIVGLNYSKIIPNITLQSRTNTESLNQNEQPVVSEDDAVVAVADNASRGVVSIAISVDQTVYERSVERVNPFGSAFPFYVEVPKLKSKGIERQVIGGGTGFIVSSDGYIVTNRHVAERTDAFYTVVMADGKEYDATVLDRDPVNDLAILKIQGSGFPVLELGDSDSIRIGQKAIAIGYALGKFNNTVSVGVISGLGRNIQAGDGAGQVEALEDLIQTDAAINPGNSGGPLLNIAGKVIGVDVAIAQGSQNVGFAIPINAVKPVIESVKVNGRIVRPQLGVRYVPVTPELASRENLSVDYGALIVKGSTTDSVAVLPDSPADKAGIVEGDIILEINNTKIDEDRSLGSLITNRRVGDTITLKILHGGEQKNIQVVLEEWKRE